MGELERSEIVLLGLFILFGVYIFTGSTEYQTGDAHIFPRLFSGMMIIFGSMLLIRNHLPKMLRDIIISSTSFKSKMDGSDEEPSSDEQNKVASSGESYSNKDLKIFTITILFVALLPLLAYVISFTYAVPILVVLYGIWRSLPIHVIGIIVLFFIGLMYMLQEFLVVPLDQGYLLNNINQIGRRLI